MTISKPTPFKINDRVYTTPSGIRIKFKREPDFYFWGHSGSWMVEHFLGITELINNHPPTKDEFNKMPIMVWNTILHMAETYYKR